MKFFLAIFAIVAAISGAASSNSHNVPALVWSNKLASPLDSSSQVAEIEGQQLMNNFGEKNIPIVALVQNALSVEQFSANDAPFVSGIFKNAESQPIFYSNVKNIPTSFSTFSEDESKIGTKNVLVHLNGKTIKENDALVKSYFEKYNNTGAVFVFTGKKNEFAADVKRSKRAAEEAPKEVGTIDGGVHSDKKLCFFLHYIDGSVTIDGEEKLFQFDGKRTYSKVNCTLPLTAKDESQAYHTDSFSMTVTPKDIPAVEVEFVFENVHDNWSIKSMKANIKGQEYTGSNFLFTPKQYSRSCGNEQFVLSREIATDKGKKIERATISFRRFQIQPFVNEPISEMDKIRFQDASDCAVWLTIPLISSLIVVLLLLSILYSGVRALMSIMTPDRFENPKGRGLIITNFEE